MRLDSNAGEKHVCTLSRRDFQDLCDPYLVRIVEYVRCLLTSFSVPISIECLLTVGSCSRMPDLLAKLFEAFPEYKTKYDDSFNAKESAVSGAALLAARLAHYANKKIKRIEVTEAISHGLTAAKMPVPISRSKSTPSF